MRIDSRLLHYPPMLCPGETNKLLLQQDGTLPEHSCNHLHTAPEQTRTGYSRAARRGSKHRDALRTPDGSLIHGYVFVFFYNPPFAGRGRGTAGCGGRNIDADFLTFEHVFITFLVESGATMRSGVFMIDMRSMRDLLIWALIWALV